MIIFSPRRENYQFSQPRKIFLIYGNTIYVLSISQNLSHDRSYISVFFVFIDTKIKFCLQSKRLLLILLKQRGKIELSKSSQSAIFLKVSIKLNKMKIWQKIHWEGKRYILKSLITITPFFFFVFYKS